MPKSCLSELTRTHLRITRFGDKTLLYVTRAYDPKDERGLLCGVAGNACFEQLRWHDFYRFLRERAEKVALVEEVMTFMEE